MSELPTSGSRETQNLIDLCLALADGEDCAEELQAAVAQRHQEMMAAMDGFFGAAEQQGEDFTKKFAKELGFVESQFGDYELALERILGWVKEPGEPDLMREHATLLAQASTGLRISTLAYEEAYLSQGPSKFPLVNLFSNLAERMRKKEIPPEIYQEAGQRYHHYYSKALEELEKSEAKDKKGFEQRKKAYTEIVGQLAEMKELGPNHDPDKMAELLSSFSRSHVDLTEAFDAYHFAEFAEGPTASPKVNWVLKAVEGVRAGTHPPGTLRGLVIDLQEVGANALKELLAASRQPIDSSLLAEDISNVIEALEGMEDSLDTLLAYSEGDQLDEEHLQEAIDMLTEYGDKMGNSHLNIKAFNENLGKVTCVKCGLKQESGGATVCVSCGAQLPQQLGGGVYDSASTSSFQVLEGEADDLNRAQVVTSTMKALFDKCEAFEKGNLSREDFFAYLETAEEQIDAAEVNLSRVEVPEFPEEATEEEVVEFTPVVELGEEALHMLALGLAECRGGIDYMRLSVEDEKPELMKEGMRVYFEGTQKMWEVRRLQKMVDDYIEGVEISEADAEIDTEEKVQLSESASADLV